MFVQNIRGIMIMKNKKNKTSNPKNETKKPTKEKIF